MNPHVRAGVERQPVTALSPSALRRRYEPDAFEFETTAQLQTLEGVVGQERAVQAVGLAIGIGDTGYNVFALGPPGTGKRSLVTQAVERRAKGRPTPPDLCYVHRFDDPQKPRLLELPAGRGAELRIDLERLGDEVRAAVRAALESDDYQERRRAIEDEVKERPRKELERLGEEARSRNLALLQTATGLAVAPTREGNVLAGEALEALPPEERQRLEAEVRAFESDVQRVVQQFPRWLREGRHRLRDLRREVTSLAVGHLVDELRRKYEALPEVLEHLGNVEHDVVLHAQEIVEPEPPLPEALLDAIRRPAETAALRRFRVNVIVDNAETRGAPVIYEDNPTYDNLVGRIEHQAQFGALTTDFSLVRAGALHRAAGGYLILEAHKLLRAPHAWEALKRALQARRLRIEPLIQSLGLGGTVTLEPEPAPLDVKVVLLGEPFVYYLLCALDPDFPELFKIAADFDDRMEATPEQIVAYVRLIATIASREGLRSLDRQAVALALEQAGRIAGHREWLTARVGLIIDLLREADFLAGEAGVSTIGGDHIRRALEAQIHRADRLRERIHGEIERGTLLIATDGRHVGQVNGLSVVELGGFAFGRPTRITARVRVGRGDVVDIEREVELGGPVHSKGVLILAAYLGARHAVNRPLSLSASLVFEQSYAGVEGDSASTAELCALLSAVAEVPLRQSIAVTGSVNQHGEVQVVGGVNEKIEGFFDVCRDRGLDGSHGVIIPDANAQHLMLREDVLSAVEAGRFHVYPVRTVDQALELLSDMPAGERDPAGRFPDGTFNREVEERLERFAEQWQTYASGGAGELAP